MVAAVVLFARHAGVSMIITTPPPVVYATVHAIGSPAEGGTVGGAGTFEVSSLVTVSAVPNAGYRFQQWTEFGNPVSSSATYSFVLGSSRTLTANFVPRELAAVETNAGWSLRFISPAPVDGIVHATIVTRTNLYVAGEFSSAGGSNVQNIARWDGARWHDVAGGVNGPIYAMVWRGRDIIVGGSFTEAGGVPATNIACWNGVSWQPVGTGLGFNYPWQPGSSVRALAAAGRHLYAGGRFDCAGDVQAANVAHWDGETWQAMGTGISNNASPHNAMVYSLALRGKRVYAGGRFDQAGTVPAKNIAVWTGSEWKDLQGGLHPGSSWFPSVDISAVYSLCFVGSRLYVGGSFGYAGGPAPSPIPPIVQDGSAPVASSIATRNLAVWTGRKWLASDNFNSTVRHLALQDAKLVACGDFTTANGAPADGIAVAAKRSLNRDTGERWTSFPCERAGMLLTAAIFRRQLYVGGSFENIGDVITGSIACWRGTNWSGLGTGTGQGITGYPGSAAVCANQYGAFLAGDFAAAGDLPMRGIAFWDGRAWSDLGGGFTTHPGTVKSVAAVGADFYVSGISGFPGLQLPQLSVFDGVACWDGLRWRASGVYPWETWERRILAADSTRLYATTMTAGPFLPYLRSLEKWNGNAWSPLPLPPSDIPEILTGFTTAAAHGDSLYVVKNGTTIHKWDGSAWSEVPAVLQGRTIMATGGMPMVVEPGIHSMIVHQGELIVAGDFVGIGGVAATNLAKWNGTSWSGVGNSGNASVYTMASSGGRLYVAGWFSRIGGVMARNVAKWDGVSWSALGSGISGGVTSMAAHGNQLYVLGDFTHAGGVRSHHFAVWTEP